ncbi:hypothetical protein FPOAC2_10373 [Fusarium poae]
MPTVPHRGSQALLGQSTDLARLDVGYLLIHHARSFHLRNVQRNLLTLGTIWPEAAAHEVTVERLRGGSYNRIIGLTRRSLDAQDDEETRYILRIPRRDAARVDDDVAALRFVQQNSSIPVPEVVAFDDTENNAIGSPYAVQVRVHGVNLYSTFPTLSHDRRCRLAREFGDMCKQMLNMRNNSAGKLVLPIDDDGMTAGVCVTPWRPLAGAPRTPQSDLAPPSPVYDTLRDVFEARKAEDVERCPEDVLRPEFMDRFIRMASELGADGWFDDQHYSIAHLDLAPHNILVDPTENKDVPTISAILDWDSAVMAPSFMSCAPPMWIWVWQDEEEEDERKANDNPPTEDGQELKRTFEEAAGPEYCRLAYEPAYRLARRLVQFAIDGINSSVDCKEAELMLTEWADVRRAGQGEKVTVTGSP